MSNETKHHYESYLAGYYSWMIDFNEKLKQNRTFFKEHIITPFANKTAIDLGAGNGLQSIPLAEAGFNVKAIDFSRKLLDELKLYSTSDVIEVIEDDILNFSAYAKLEPELIVCMGDTLTHLNDMEEVKALISNSYNILVPKGKFILSFRDLSSELEGEDRFILVRSDSSRIFTCFLEYFPGYVKVHDIVNENKDGSWVQKVSLYKKLRLSASEILIQLKDSGFTIDEEVSERGMVTLICHK